jgi:hypothetical protein
MQLHEQETRGLCAGGSVNGQDVALEARAAEIDRPVHRVRELHRPVLTRHDLRPDLGAGDDPGSPLDGPPRAGEPPPPGSAVEATRMR